jgi:hypothetical protein
MVTQRDGGQVDPGGPSSVRSMSWSRSGTLSRIPAAAAISFAASSGVKRSSRPDLGHLPAARRRASGSGGSARVMITICADGGRCSSRNWICSWQRRSLIMW